MDEPAADPASMRRRWRSTVLVAALSAAATVGGVVALLEVPAIREYVGEELNPYEPRAPQYAFDLRSALLDERDREMASRDLVEAAEINAVLAQEALLRTRAVHDAWLSRRDPQTKLYAQNEQDPQWNYRNTAADFFCFQLQAAVRLNPEAMSSIRQTLDAEAELRTAEGLCIPVDAATLDPVGVDHVELVFGSAEYVKDGLISVFERYGGEIVQERMLAIIDAIMAESREASQFGPIPGEGAEVNGDLLQVTGRLSYALGRDDYAEFGARIADAVIQQSVAHNHGIPPKFFDYETNSVVEETLKLKDHGNEILLGLSEMYAMAVDRSEQPAWAERADRWVEPMARMYEIVLEHGVTKSGLFSVTMQPNPPQPTSDRISDNWGYVLLGALLFTEAAERDGALDAARIAQIRARVDEIARVAFAQKPDVGWTGGMDGAADSLEGALYMGAYRPALRGEALTWADEAIRLMYAWQDRDGTTGKTYLDGNFMRTAMMYADARSGGWRVEPWRPDVQVGFAEDGHGSAAVVVRTGEPYTGRLVPDRPRHRQIMNLPWNWPRLNSWPEWFAVTPDMQVTEAVGLPTPSITDLADGIDIALPAHGEATLLLKRPAPADADKSSVVGTD